MIKPCDTLLAIKATAIAPDLIDSDRRVLATILDHFNRRTGQCDPSLETIARLLGISRRTVIRAVKRVVSTGYLKKAKHGGRYYRNSYAPVWERFQLQEQRWRESRRCRSANASATVVSPLSRQSRHLPGDGRGTQTCSKNLIQETSCSIEHNAQSTHDPRKSVESSFDKQPLQSAARPIGIQGREKRLPNPARSAAQNRWEFALLSRCEGAPELYSQVVELVDQDLADIATDAELAEHGSGVDVITHALDQSGHRGVATALARLGGRA